MLFAKKPVHLSSMGSAFLGASGLHHQGRVELDCCRYAVGGRNQQVRLRDSPLPCQPLSRRDDCHLARPRAYLLLRKHQHRRDASHLPPLAGLRQAQAADPCRQPCDQSANAVRRDQRRMGNRERQGGGPGLWNSARVAREQNRRRRLGRGPVSFTLPVRAVLGAGARRHVPVNAPGGDCQSRPRGSAHTRGVSEDHYAGRKQGRMALWQHDTNVTQSISARPDSHISAKPQYAHRADRYWDSGAGCCCRRT